MSKIRCMECGVTLESKFRHDFNKCQCSNEAFVDGGDDYFRVGAVDFFKVEVFNEESSTWINLGESNRV